MDNVKYKLEADLTEVVKSWLDTQNDLCYTKISDRFKKGISDILMCVRGIFVATELKAENNTPSPHQKFFIKSVINAGGIGGTCYTLGQVKVLVDEARRIAPKN
jgi:hypothetical protein